MVPLNALAKALDMPQQGDLRGLMNNDSSIGACCAFIAPVPQHPFNLPVELSGPSAEEGRAHRPIPILAFCEGSLPGGETISGCTKYCNPSLPAFPHGNVALYILGGPPQYKLDTSSFQVGVYECVTVELKFGGRSLTVP